MKTVELACLLVSSTLLPVAVSATRFEEKTAEYLRDYPRRQTAEFVLRSTVGDPARINAWLVP